MLTDGQLEELGLTALGDHLTLRQFCADRPNVDSQDQEESGLPDLQVSQTSSAAATVTESTPPINKRENYWKCSGCQ